MSSEIITSNDLKKILASAFPARANTTITSIALPYTPPCNGIFFGMLRAAAQGRAYKQYSNTEPSLWDFYQVAGGYSIFASFVQAGKQIAETSTANISETPYYFFVPLDGTSPLLGGNADAVIEQGASGAWTYRKWASGKVEAWYSNAALTISATNTKTAVLPHTPTRIINLQVSGTGNGFIGQVYHCWVPSDNIPVVSASTSGSYQVWIYIIYTVAT